MSFGVRVDKEENLEFVAARIARFGWELRQEQEVVDVLFSVRVGGAQADGRRRNYHLVYSDGTLQVRTLSKEILTEELDQAILGMVEPARGMPLVFQGAVVEDDSKRYFLRLGESGEHEPELRTVLGERRIFLTSHGEVRNLPRVKLSGVTFPALPSTEPLTGGLYYANLRAHCYSEVAYAAPLLREFMTAVPHRASFKLSLRA